MKFASMLRNLRNTQESGTRPVVSSDPYCPYHPYIANRPELKIVLTFDDGPASTEASGYNRTQQVMTELEARKITGVFFVQTHARIRGGSDDGEGVIRDTHNRKHILALHTTVEGIHPTIDGADPHNSHFYHSAMEERGELAGSLEGGKNRIRDITADEDGDGVEVEFVRPPGGVLGDKGPEIRKRVIQTYSNLDLELVMWDIDPERGARGNAATICDNIDTLMRQYLAGGPKTQMVALFHDVQGVVVQNLPAFIDQIKSVACALGYRPIFNLTREQVKEVLRAQTDEN